VLYRHGDRSPVAVFPTDKYASYWPDGLGRLTQKGMRMEFELGEFFRSRYTTSNFLNTSYLHKEVYCKSSDSERCLMSAESQMAGLYPPSGWQIWNKNILWQPVPVHTVPGKKDPYLRPWDYDCPRLKELIQQKMQSKEYIDVTEKNKGLFEFLEKNTGLKSIAIESIWVVYDTLFVEKSHNLTMPKWLNATIWNQMERVALFDFKYRFTGNDEFSRLSGGSLIGLIRSGMINMSKNKKDAFKLNVYSAHDTTVLALLGSLGLYNGTTIPYATTVLVELYEIDQGKFVVEMYLRNSSSSPLYQLNLKGCTPDCPLSDFFKLLSNRIPSDLDKECGNQNAPKKTTNKHMNLVIGLGIVSGILTILLLIMLVQQCRGKTQRDDHYFQGVANDDESNENLLNV